MKDFRDEALWAAYAEGRADEAEDHSNADTISRLFAVWVENTGKPVPWNVAIHITAIIKNLSDAERGRLLALDDE